MITLNNKMTYLNIWKGTFADKYKDRPRLYRALVENDVFFSEDNDLLVVIFCIQNDAQKQWIQATLYNEFVERFLSLTGMSAMDLRIVTDDDFPF